jgi:hypothetical protein
LKLREEDTVRYDDIGIAGRQSCSTGKEGESSAWWNFRARQYVARHRSEEYERARLGQARASGLETKGKGVEVRCYCGSGCSVSLVHKWQYSITLPVYCYHCIAIVLYHNVFHTLNTWLFDSGVCCLSARTLFIIFSWSCVAQPYM